MSGSRGKTRVSVVREHPQHQVVNDAAHRKEKFLFNVHSRPSAAQSHRHYQHYQGSGDDVLIGGVQSQSQSQRQRLGNRVQAEANAPLPRTLVAHGHADRQLCTNEDSSFDPMQYATKVASEAEARRKAKQQKVEAFRELSRRRANEAALKLRAMREQALEDEQSTNSSIRSGSSLDEGRDDSGDANGDLDEQEERQHAHQQRQTISLNDLLQKAEKELTFIAGRFRQAAAATTVEEA